MYIGHLYLNHKYIREKVAVTLNQGNEKCVLVLAHGLYPRSLVPRYLTFCEHEGRSEF